MTATVRGPPAEPNRSSFAWDPESTYVRKPPYFDGMTAEPESVADITGARVLAKLGDSVTTDHISPGRCDQDRQRIHRSNLVGMGVLPLRFRAGENARTLGPTGEETFAITGNTALNSETHREVVVRASDAADWGIAAFTGRSPALADSLAAQDAYHPGPPRATGSRSYAA